MGAHPIPPDSREVVFSLQNVSCRECGSELEALAVRQPGVRQATFDPAKVELHVWLDPSASPDPVVAAITEKPVDGRDVRALVGPGKGAYAPFLPLDPAWDAKQISPAGEDVPDLAAQRGSGRTTVFDFYADWCGPCHALDDHMHALLKADARLAYRRLNVVSWDTPLAKHYLSNVAALPFVIVLGNGGKEVARISGLKLDELDAAIAKGERQ